VLKAIVEMDRPRHLLSVCIPTYDRPRQFRRLAELLCLQDKVNEIELVIRDDSPNQETLKIVQEILIPAGINVRYYHGEKIGLDAANLFLIENASGNYLWWFSDDDEMRPGALAHIINLLESDEDIRYIWANFDYEDEGNSVVDTTCRYFSSGDDVIETLGVNIGLISTHILHRETAIEAVELAKKNLYGFGFAALIPVFHIITSLGKFYLLGTSYILCNPTKADEIILLTNRNGKIDNRGFEVYGVNFYRIVTLFNGRFSNKSVRDLLSKNFASLWRGMLVGWVRGWDTPKGKRLRMLKIYWNFPECWVALPIFWMPLPIAKIFYQIYKIFFSHRKFVLWEKILARLVK
jgi:abequosyltransferase